MVRVMLPVKEIKRMIKSRTNWNIKVLKKEFVPQLLKGLVTADELDTEKHYLYYILLGGLDYPEMEIESNLEMKDFRSIATINNLLCKKFPGSSSIDYFKIKKVVKATYSFNQVDKILFDEEGNG